MTINSHNWLLCSLINLDYRGTPLITDTHSNIQIYSYGCVANFILYTGTSWIWFNVLVTKVEGSTVAICYGSQSRHCIYAHRHFIIHIPNQDNTQDAYTQVISC